MDVPGKILAPLSDFILKADGLLKKSVKVMTGVGACTFTESRLGMLCGLMNMYRDLLKELQVKDRKELDEILKKYHNHTVLGEIIEEYLQFEQLWDDFILTLEKEISSSNQSSSLLKIGDHLPEGFDVKCVKDGHSVTSVDKFSEDENVSNILLILLRHFA